MPASHAIPLEGRLNTWGGGLSRSIGGDLPDLLVGVCRRGKTGQLRIQCPDGDRTLFVKQGRIIFAESSSRDDRLGEYLLRKGRIRLSDYHDLSKKVGKGKRLGTLLVENGFLELEELVPSVIGQVRRIVVQLFRQVDFSYEFTEKRLRKEPITLEMRLAELVMEGVQKVDSWPRLFRGIGDLKTVYRVRNEAVEEFTGLKVDPDVLRLLTLLDQPTEVSEAGAKAKLSDFRCAQFLWAFRSLDWIEPVQDRATQQAVAAVAKSSAPPQTSEPTEPAQPASTTPESEATPVVQEPPSKNGPTPPAGAAERAPSIPTPPQIPPESSPVPAAAVEPSSDVEPTPAEVVPEAAIEVEPIPVVAVSDASLVEVPLQTVEVVIDDSAPVLADASEDVVSVGAEGSAPTLDAPVPPATSDTLTGLQDFDFDISGLEEPVAEEKE